MIIHLYNYLSPSERFSDQVCHNMFVFWDYLLKNGMYRQFPHYILQMFQPTPQMGGGFNTFGQQPAVNGQFGVTTGVAANGNTNQWAAPAANQWGAAATKQPTSVNPFLVSCVTLMLVNIPTTSHEIIIN